MTEKKILLWFGTGANQKALAAKIHARFGICGIIIDEKRAGKKTPFIKRAWTAMQDRIFYKQILFGWLGMQIRYEQQYPDWPQVAVKRVDSINRDEAYEFSRLQQPDLIVVSGTALVKSKMLSLKPGIGIINLHTGLSPYIKGGPNCTNWCISTNQPDLIGNTIMWINEGIDSGNIIATEQTMLQPTQNLSGIQWQVMEHAHDLYLRSIDYLLHSVPPYQSVVQKEIGKGTLYLTRMWNSAAKRKLLKHLPGLLRKGNNPQKGTVVTIPLKSAPHGV